MGDSFHCQNLKVVFVLETHAAHLQTAYSGTGLYLDRIQDGGLLKG
jgi:hypothetical protein